MKLTYIIGRKCGQNSTTECARARNKNAGNYRDIPLNCNDIVNYFIAICQSDHSITKSLFMPIRDITEKLRTCFSGHLLAPNKKLHSKF